MIIYKNESDSIKFVNNKRVNPGYMLVEENGKLLTKKIEKISKKIIINNKESNNIIKEIVEPTKELIIDKTEDKVILEEKVEDSEIVEEKPKKKRKYKRKNKSETEEINNEENITE